MTDQVTWQSPYDRGDSDAYYGRLRGGMARPHKRKCNPPGAYPLHEDVYDLTPEETADYWRGADENPSGRKDWR